MDRHLDQKSNGAYEDVLKGTTLQVYRFMLRSRAPLGIHDIQRTLRLSSPSVAQYHIKKLSELKLIKEVGGGYVVDKIIIDNIIRIRRTAIPLQSAYVAFFASSLVIMLSLLRPTSLSSTYLFATLVIVVGLIISVRETLLTLRHL
jgi:hypothetical protein